MLRRRVRGYSAAALAAVLLIGACSSGPEEAESVIEVFGPYRGAEAASFAATVEPFEERSGVDVRYVGAGSFATDMQMRVAEADYPDIGIFPQPAIVADFAAQGILAPMPDVLRADSVSDAQTLGIAGLEESGVAVWFRAAAKSLVWYRPDVFADRGYVVPATWGELMALSDTMIDDGLSPWCLAIESFGSTGWVGTDWIEDLVLRQQGPDVYAEWVTGEVKFESPEIRRAFTTFDSILHNADSVFGGTDRIMNEAWQRAADPMFKDPAECMMHRQASFWAPEIPGGFDFPDDIDFFVLPGLTEDPPPVLVSGDVAAAFNDRPEVAAFMEFLASPEAGAEWAKRGGFVSPHKNFDSGNYSSKIDLRVDEIISNAPYIRFDGSDLMPPAVGSGAFWTAMKAFIRNGDVSTAVTTIDESWPDK